VAAAPADVVAFTEDPPVVANAVALEDVATVEARVGVDDTTALEDELAAGVELVEDVDFGAEGRPVVDAGSLIPQTTSASKGPKGSLYAIQLTDARSMASLILSAMILLGH
jgi:hypothetical protein